MNHRLTSRWNRALTAFLLLAIIGAIGLTTYLVFANKEGARFTEFYLLGLDGKADNYPSQLTVGQEAKVIAGIGNREEQTVTYRIEVKVNDAAVNRVDAIVLKPRQNWQQVVAFKLDKAGKQQKVDFLLYRSGDAEAYREVYLFVNVR